MPIKSLTARVLLLTTIWSAMALVVIGFVISTLYRNSAERGFQDLLRAQLYNVINSVTIGEQGTLAGNPQLGDLRYAQPKTGWYWIVEPLGTFTSAPLVSPSLGSVNLPVLSVMEAPFNKSYERYYIVTDSVGNRVQVAETEIVFVEGDGRAARFRVTGNIGVIESDVEAFSHSLYLALVVFGIGSLIVNALAILYGLRPLDEARGALERIRAGESERLQGNFPREILPLANEVNALIDSNRRIVERARMQVGNLAHSLKTPIAVLLNESRVLDQSHGDLVKGQAEAMQGQVQSYLNRARIAAQRESVLARTEAEPALERLVRVMRRLNTEIEFQLTVSPGLALAMEQQDLEETVGNLLENAARFAKTKVIVTASEAAPDVKGLDPARRHWVALNVEDDGPGLEPDQIREAMKRGRRLDETKPGTGLGLSIVSEITAEYQGLLTLSRGSAGGLQAALILPGIVKDVA